MLRERVILPAPSPPRLFLEIYQELQLMPIARAVRRLPGRLNGQIVMPWQSVQPRTAGIIVGHGKLILALP